MSSTNPNALSFFEHLEELRKVFLRCLVLVSLFTLIALCLYPYIFAFFQDSYAKHLLPTGLQSYKLQEVRVINTSEKNLLYNLPSPKKVEKMWLDDRPLQLQNSISLSPGSQLRFQLKIPFRALQLISPLEGLFSILKLGLLSGIAFSLPFCLYWFYGFISPAVTNNLKKVFVYLLILSCFNLILGIYLGSVYALPFAIQTFEAFNQSLGENHWTLSSYLDLASALLMGAVLFLQIVLAMLSLVHSGKVDAQTLGKGRKAFIVIAFILGALFTPPDVPSQLAFAVPLIIFYELCYLYCLARRYMRPISASS